MFRKILVILFLHFTLINSVMISKVIYDKDNIIITDYEVEALKKILSQDKKREVSKEEAIKEYVLTRKTINRIIKVNPNLLEAIDSELASQIDEINFENKIIKNILRFKKIKNLYIRQYLNEQFTANELKESLNDFKEWRLPVSQNECITYESFFDFKDNDDFINFLYQKIKNKPTNFKFEINGVPHQVCIDEVTFNIVKNNIYLYLDKKILVDIRKSI